MTDTPPLSIVLLTYKRTEYALRTIRALSKYLGYEKELRGWYIADDGTPPEDGHIETLLNELRKKDEKLIGYHSQRYSPNTGIGWNKGLGIAHQHSDFVLFLEDDWVLKTKLDIHPYVQLLCEREDVAMVRLGHLPVNSIVETVGHGGIHYLKYLRERQYAYSGNPHIRHARLVKSYGWFSEDELNPGELELNYDGRFRSQEGPDIWRPADIPGWGIFDHIGEARYR